MTSDLKLPIAIVLGVSALCAAVLLLRLVGAVLLEINDEWAVQRSRSGDGLSLHSNAPFLRCSARVQRTSMS
jgi:hypothetical protein